MKMGAKRMKKKMVKLYKCKALRTDQKLMMTAKKRKMGAITQRKMGAIKLRKMMVKRWAALIRNMKLMTTAKK